MRATIPLAWLITLGAALPTTSDVANPLANPLTPRAGKCDTTYKTGDYCEWFCSDCKGTKSPKSVGCVNGLCVSGCMTAIGYNGYCTSHWNDGNTWAFKCTDSSSGTWGMSRWKMKEMGLDCWGGNGGAWEEFWCLCW